MVAHNLVQIIEVDLVGYGVRGGRVKGQILIGPQSLQQDRIACISSHDRHAPSLLQFQEAVSSLAFCIGDPVRWRESSFPDLKRAILSHTCVHDALPLNLYVSPLDVPHDPRKSVLDAVSNSQNARSRILHHILEVIPDRQFLEIGGSRRIQ